MLSRLLPSLAFIAGASALAAAPLTFDFKDPKGVNAIQFHLDSVLEPISGTAGGVRGTVTYDPANPAATKGRIVVDAKSLVVPNATMTEHIHSDGWLAVGANPEIAFDLTSLSDIKTSPQGVSAVANGTFSLKGVSKPIAVPVRITHLPDAMGKRMNKAELKGDLLVIRGEFTIKRADYGIQPGRNEDKVSPEVKVSLGIVGSAPKA